MSSTDDKIDQAGKHQSDLDKAAKLKYLYDVGLLQYQGMNVSDLSKKELVGFKSWCQRKANKEEDPETNKAWVEIFQKELDKYKY